MAAEEGDSRVNASLADLPQQSPPPFVEVVCKISGQRRRFAAGTEAGFAVSLINRKLLLLGGGGGGRFGYSHIEAVKEGEEPVSFGPNSVLIDYGDGWELQTVAAFEGLRKEEQNLQAKNRIPEGLVGSYPKKTGMTEDSPAKPISFIYIGKILFAFILIFALGASLTVALENLPKLILLISSSI